MTAVAHPDGRPMIARDVLRALYRHLTPRYAMLTEITHRVVAPDSPPDARWPILEERRIDALLVSKTERIAVEVKVARADFLSDVRRPEKQAPWRAITHRFTYAAPAGLIRAEELPPDTGLIEVFPDGLVTWRVKVRRRPDCDPMPPRITYACMIRLAIAEAGLKGYGLGTAGREEDPAALIAEVARLQADLLKEQNARFKAEQTGARWRQLYALHDPPPCAFCGEPVIPGRSRVTQEKYRGGTWKHRAPAHDQPCYDLRVAAASHPMTAELVHPADPTTGELADDHT